MKTKAQATKIKRLRAWLMAGLTTGMMTSASAQSITTNNTTTVGPVTPLDCDRIYVDPVNGSNNGTGTFNNPLLRIQDAIWAATPPAVVVALPGVYSSSTNGESFPLWMREGISLQGNSAMDTILDGEGFSSEIIRFMPTSSSDTFNNVLIDGVMITGGGTGVYMGDEFHPIGPQFSNCFIVKNGVGVHIFALYDSGIYPSFYPRFINNTISYNDIGILDEGNWVSWDPDPDGRVEGEAAPAIVNCLIYPNGVTDLEGVDGTDILNSIFCTVDQAGISRVKLGLPNPVPVQGSCQIDPTTLFVNVASFDYRVMPQTLPVDAGSDALRVANGNSGKRTFPCGLDIMDADAEGYGNPRVERNGIDIGGDEQAPLLIAGYIPKTTTLGTDPATGAAYTQASIFLTPNPGIANPVLGLTLLGMPFQTGSLTWTPFNVPGTRAVGTSPVQVIPSFGNLYIDTSLYFRRITLGYPPVGTPLVLNLGSAPLATEINMQVIPYNLAGQGTLLTNLQSFTWDQ